MARFYGCKSNPEIWMSLDLMATLTKSPKSILSDGIYARKEIFSGTKELLPFTTTGTQITSIVIKYIQ
jgi:hypothetical protein